MSERLEAPDERASGSEVGAPALSSSAGSVGSGSQVGAPALSSSAGSVGSGSEAGPEAASGATGQPAGSGPQGQGPGLGRRGHQKVGRAAPNVARAAPDAQELRDRGRELREIARERARGLREQARAQRELQREQAQELRDLARAQRAMALGLRGHGRNRTGNWTGDGSAAGDEKSTRDRVLDVALDIFIEQGYDKASLREIAERMGFTKAALYYHFPSKTDMLLALHDRMHSIIDEPLSLLGSGIVTVAMWEKFLDASISAMQGNQKLFQMHRVNQAALAGVHSQGHEGTHQEIEEQAMRIFSEPSLSPEDRLRMAAAFAVSFFTPFITSGLFSDKGDDFLPKSLREIVHGILEPEPAKSEAGTEAVANKRETEKPAP
jgi:AcrR family transcriptional regulator